MRIFKRRIQKEDIYFVFNEGGLGDQIARLTPIKYCLDNYPWVTPNLIVPEYFKDYAQYIFPDIKVMNFDESNVFFEKEVKSLIKYNKKLTLDQAKREVLSELKQIKSDIGLHSMIRTNLVDCAYNCLLDYQPDDIKHKNYLSCPPLDVSIFNVPNKFVVITTMFTAKVRELPPKVVSDIVDYCKEIGYKIVFLGKSKARAGDMHTIKGETHIDYDMGINLVDKTSLMEAATIMSKAAAVIGLDNGLLHLAATTDVPIIYGFTTVEPHHRLPVRHNEMGWNIQTIVPDEDIDCRFCQSKMNFVYNHKFTECFYGDYKCIKKMDSEPYIEALKNIIEQKQDKRINK